MSMKYRGGSAHVMALEADGDTLRLVTQYGYECTTEPYGQVDGDVVITGVDWESFSVTQVLDQPDAQGIEFTLSGTIVGGGGPEDGTWTFRLVTEDPDLPQYYMSFDAWFGET